MSNIKKKNIISLVKNTVKSGNYIYTGHANLRIRQRQVTRFEVKQALLSGHHEKRKDIFDREWNSWNYSIKGKTIDKRKLRIVINFDKDNMLIITVIDLDK